MSLASKILTSHLLMIIFAPKGDMQKIIWGPLNEHIYLNISRAIDSSIDDIRWHKDNIEIVQLKRNSQNSQEKYEAFMNGTLKIKHLMNKDKGYYSMDTYDKNGKHIFRSEFVLQIQERVSEPAISWNCTLNTLTCQVANGTGIKLELSVNGKTNGNNMKIITANISTKRNTVRCKVSNYISMKTNQKEFDCSGKDLNLYLILAICGTGVLALLFVALFIFYICRRKKQTRQNNDQMEIQVRRVPTKEKGQRPPLPNPGSSPNPAMGQPPCSGHRPQTPGHHLQVPGQRLPQPGVRVPHSQQKKPHHSGPQVHQQKGPPLPRPRAQAKPLRGAKEHA